VSKLLAKLRYQPGMTVAVLGAPAGFEAELARAKVTRAPKLKPGLDLVQAFYTRLAHAERDAPRLAKAAPKIVWLCYPKARGLETDLARDVLREAVARHGLEAVAICAIDDVWSALRCKLTVTAASAARGSSRRASGRAAR
jgi:hypothetical protein